MKGSVGVGAIQSSMLFFLIMSCRLYKWIGSAFRPETSFCLWHLHEPHPVQSSWLSGGHSAFQLANQT